ncbi:MAG: SMC-Scp complex subunit ScpB [Rhodospirillales bacterium]|nr:SMC-Scp complex subunit ScpB [Rhodospirillales bacterium]MCW9040116.1 SMC-Scp complex subunit ScpB [Rhodospirillales bacterium]
MNDIDSHHLRLLEAVLFASAEVIPEKALAERLPEGADLPALIDALRRHYEPRGVNLVQAGKGWAFRTSPDLARQLSMETKVTRKLSRAAVETLAVISYHQPVTRAEVEEIRGVGLSKGTMDVLFEEGWIKPKGRRRTPGRPVTWGTTDAFLDHFGLESLSDLPGIEELKAAGLLDARPALTAYQSRGALTNSTDAEDTRDEEDELEEGDDGTADLSDVAEDSGDEVIEELEPLDPDDEGVL